MKISKKFKITKSQNELDFIDIDINKDIPLFIDPYRISKLSGPFIDELNSVINNFFSYLVELIKVGDYEKAKSIFVNLSEVNETCLGLSKGKPRGNGMGPKKTQEFFDAIKRSRAASLGVLQSIEDIKVFVAGINSDRISDMTTNIIKKKLIEYTQNQCRIFNIPLTPGIASGMFWDINSRTWKQEYTDMLIINGKKYLLVPKIIVTYGDGITASKYYNEFVLNFMQNENIRNKTELVQYRKGKKTKGNPYVTKKDIKEKQISTNIEKEGLKDWLAGFTNAHPRVFTDFKDKTFNNMKTVDFKEDRKQIADYLIKKLNSIEPGNDNATEYHVTMLCILEFIFYPNISNPKKEVEINDGRKRIDIVYNNTAKEGFFYDLIEKYDIPSSLIMAECKNYSTDVKNPELDQLLGRFSKHRGKFGFSLSRMCNDKETLYKRCSDILKDSDNLIIPLIDEDILFMLNGIKNGNDNIGETALLEKYTKIVLQ